MAIQEKDEIIMMMVQKEEEKVNDEEGENDLRRGSDQMVGPSHPNHFKLMMI